jgi:hypothetical protein
MTSREKNVSSAITTKFVTPTDSNVASISASIAAVFFVALSPALICVILRIKGFLSRFLDQS